MANDNKSYEITECPTHMVSQPGCMDCVKEAEYFLLHWREMEEKANKAIKEWKDEDDDK